VLLLGIPYGLAVGVANQSDSRRAYIANTAVFFIANCDANPANIIPVTTVKSASYLQLSKFENSAGFRLPDSGCCRIFQNTAGYPA
jgi:hypothetical protein